MIREFIFREVPDSTFMGEEGGPTGTGEVCWYVDPIDGTANFARGMAFWCVLIGALIGGRIVAGVILDPVSGNLFTGSADGAFLNGQPMQSRAAPDEARGVLIPGYPVARDFRLEGRVVALDRFGTLTATFATLRRPGSAALSLAHVAAGWADAAAGFGVNPWDVTAAILILRQVGGVICPMALAKCPMTPRISPARGVWHWVPGQNIRRCCVWHKISCISAKPLRDHPAAPSDNRCGTESNVAQMVQDCTCAHIHHHHNSAQTDAGRNDDP